MPLSEKAVQRVADVFCRAELGDPRLVRRAVGLSQALATAPNLSLPRVWASQAQLEAGYRFLRNPRTEFTALMEPVQQATRQAALRSRRVLVIHDTTDIECSSAEPDEVGYLQTGRAGFYVHHALCVEEGPSGCPLGIVWSELWGRSERSKGRTRAASGGALAKLEERESDRWLESLSQAQLWAEGCESVVHVMDREADAYRLFEQATALSADFVVRMRHDRCTDDGRVSEELARAQIKLLRLVPLGRRRPKTMPRHTYQGREARQAKLVVRSATIRVQPPSYMRTHDAFEVNVVQILEEDPPEGVQPVSWVLATSLPIATRVQLERIIDIYRARWQIEEFHKALKTGCMFEKRQLESFDSITTLLAICYPIACELLRIRSRARQPGIPAHAVLRSSLLDCLRAHPNARKLPNSPTAEQALGAIAALGGHQKHNGPPGWQTLAAGYMTLLQFEQGWLAAIASRNL
jgi:hypothetical protein